MKPIVIFIAATLGLTVNAQTSDFQLSIESNPGANQIAQMERPVLLDEAMGERKMGRVEDQIEEYISSVLSFWVR